MRRVGSFEFGPQANGIAIGKARVSAWALRSPGGAVDDGLA
jgi:hypothetical protein